MSALLEGARRLLGRKSDLADQIYGLDQAVEACRGRLDDAAVDPAATIVERAGTRLRLSPEHTVVAIAGATGSGKSSTFNALTGLDLAAVGVRRPTTSWATACIWGGPGGAEELLEWMGIPLRHQTTRDSMLDAGTCRAGPQGPGPARPPRPRLDRGQPPPRGGAADRAGRPDDLGAGPAEVRRQGGARGLLQADGLAQGRHDRRAQPHRRGAARRVAREWSRTSSGCSRSTGSTACP